MREPPERTIVRVMLSQAENNTLGPSVNPSEFIAFCDGLEQAGLEDYARRGRMIARELAESQRRVEELRVTLERITLERDRWRDDRWRETHGQAWPT